MQTEIERMDKSLAAKRAEVKRLEGRLGQVSQEAGRTEAEIAVYKASMKMKEADLAARLRAMYKAGRTGSKWALLVSDDYGTMMKRYKYLSVISQHDKRLIDGYTDDIEELARQGEKLRGQRAEFDKLRQARDLEAQKVLAEEGEKRKLLASVRERKNSYLAMANELEESGRRMKELIRKLEDETKSRPRSPMPALPAPPAVGLEWPVSGKVISVFGRQKHPTYDAYIFKKGIEIQAATGTEVRAAGPAEVVFANWFRGLGLIAILRHGGDLYSVYAHLSELKVKTGERVAGGQAIAILGDAGAPSGPSLYFEVRKGSEAQDPLKWLRRK